MIVRYKGDTHFLGLTHGETYVVMSVERNWYRIIDGSGEDYLYPPELFDIVKS